MRVKSRWHNKNRTKSTEEIAQAVGYVAWRMARTTVDKLYNSGFNFRSNAQLLDTMGEIAIYLLQMADRMVYEQLDDDERQRFVMALANKLIEAMVDNRVTEQGEGEYAQPFIDLINRRLDGYAEFQYLEDGPSYAMLRYFGSCVDEVMGGSQNKWVIEHMMEVESPDLYKSFKRGLENLLEGRAADAGERDGPLEG